MLPPLRRTNRSGGGVGTLFGLHLFRRARIRLGILWSPVPGERDDVAAGLAIGAVTERLLRMVTERQKPRAWRPPRPWRHPPPYRKALGTSPYPSFSRTCSPPFQS